MAAQIIDDEVLAPQEIEDKPEQLTLNSIDQEEPEEEAQAEPEIPAKYQGKSINEVIEMHREAEKLLGRQSSEVGELRKVVDQYIQNAAKEAPQEEEIDFFDDPEKAVQKAIERHPKIREAEEMTAQYRKNDTLNRLQAKYPDMMKTVQDPKFAEWVQASKIRTQLYILADQQSDYDAADELLGNWQERQRISEQTVELEKKSRKESIKKASTGNVSGTGESSRKVYRRSDIIKLMREDPDRYTALSDEIMQAYKEGRVK